MLRRDVVLFNFSLCICILFMKIQLGLLLREVGLSFVYFLYPVLPPGRDVTPLKIGRILSSFGQSPGFWLFAFWTRTITFFGRDIVRVPLGF